MEPVIVTMVDNAAIRAITIFSGRLRIFAK
jgi:hypothetical protein